MPWSCNNYLKKTEESSLTVLKGILEVIFYAEMYLEYGYFMDEDVCIRVHLCVFKMKLMNTATWDIWLVVKVKNGTKENQLKIIRN